MEELRQEYKLKRTQFFVEATNHEYHSLWEKHHDEHNWDSDGEGCMVLCGEVKINGQRLPVYVDLRFAQIDGIYVCFYYGCSRVVDWDMIEKFINRYPCKYDGGTRRAVCDANNFHQFLGAIDELKKNKKHEKQLN